ncbi:MAG: hypothetical protein ACFFDI_18715 [Promethearchaeota archaeon]
MSSTFFERLGQNPVVVAILLFDCVTSLIFFLFPLTLYFLGDVCIFIGMIISIAYILYPKDDPINITKTILLTAFLGGIITALSLSIVIFLLLWLAGMTTPLLNLFIQTVVYTVALALIIGIVVIIIIRVKDSLIKKEAPLLELE